MYIKRNKEEMKQLKVISIEDIVPQDHILRKIEVAIDFSFIYDEVKGMYLEKEWGNPGIDPVSLFKIVILQYMFGIKSMRQTIKEIEVNMAYRWFIGYDIGEKNLIFQHSERTIQGDFKEQMFLKEYSNTY